MASIAVPNIVIVDENKITPAANFDFFNICTLAIDAKRADMRAATVAERRALWSRPAELAGADKRDGHAPVRSIWTIVWLRCIASAISIRSLVIEYACCLDIRLCVACGVFILGNTGGYNGRVVVIA